VPMMALEWSVVAVHAAEDRQGAHAIAVKGHTDKTNLGAASELPSAESLGPAPRLGRLLNPCGRIRKPVWRTLAIPNKCMEDRAGLDGASHATVKEIAE